MIIFIGFVKQNIIYLITILSILKINIKIKNHLCNLESILFFLIIFFLSLEIAISYFHFFLFFVFLFYFFLLSN